MNRLFAPLFFRLLLTGVLLLFAVIGCSKPDQIAKRELQEKAIPLTEDEAVQRAADADFETLRLMETAGIQVVQARDAEGNTPLLAAVKNDQLEALDYLLDRGHDIETQDANGDTALLAAVRVGNLEMVEHLVKAKANIQATNLADLNPLTMAVVTFHPKITKVLLEAGADPMAEIAPGCSALVFATAHGQSKIVSELLSAGADANRREALPSWHRLAAMLQSADDAPAIKADQLLAAVPGENNGQLTAMLLRPRPVETEIALATSPVGSDLSALALAIRNRDKELAETLLKNGADANAVTEKRLPPLMLAAIEGDRDIVRSLLKHGADIGARDASGDTALAYAVHFGQADVIPILVEMGADPNSLSHEGQPLVAMATVRGQPTVLDALLKAGADPNTRLVSPPSEAFLEKCKTKHLRKMLKEDSRLTPLMVAASHGDTEIIRTLKKNGAKTNQFTAEWKFYPINFAIVQKHLDAAQLLLGMELDPTGNQAHVIISLGKQRAYLKENGKTLMESPVSTGMRGYRTPKGEYVISNKHRHWTSTLYNAPMPYFMRFNCGSFGMHVGKLPGYPASHGCIRMPWSKARAFYNKLPTGTRVSIVD